MSRKFKLIDLFCGAGGMSLGFVSPRFSNAFESVVAIDNDPASIETYNANFGNKNIHHGLEADIEEWAATAKIPSADVVIGGPPCQGFSLLNKKRLGDSRRALWEPYLDVVENSGASVFVMENVVGLLKSIEFEDIQARANALGFSLLNPSVLNMANYGVPQTRKRTIIVGVRSNRFNLNKIHGFPPPASHQFNVEDHDSLPWVTVRDAISDLPRRTKGLEIRVNDPAPLDLHFGRKPTETSKQRYKAVPPGGNRFDLQKNRPDITPDCWIRKTSGGTDLFGRLWWDRPSVTIRTEFFKPEKGRYLHPTANRPITHREAARIMTFPDDFKFKGSKVEIARQIGNAVPPVFASVIANYVANLFYHSTRNKPKSKALKSLA